MGGLLTWWNLIFLIPLGIAVIYLGLSVTFGLFDGGEHDHEHDLEHDHDLDHEHDVDLAADHDHDVDLAHDHDHDLDVGHGLHHDHDHGHHGESHGSAAVNPLAALLWVIGARHVTTGLALQLFLLNWGALGLLVNALLIGWLGESWLLMLVSLPLTALLSVGLTRAATSALGYLLPKDESAAESRAALEGRPAHTLWSTDADSGAAVLTDRFGQRHQVAARSTGAAIPRGAEVMLIEYVAEGDYFTVEPVADLLADRLTSDETAAVEEATAADRD